MKVINSYATQEWKAMQRFALELIEGQSGIPKIRVICTQSLTMIGQGSEIIIPNSICKIF